MPPSYSRNADQFLAQIRAFGGGVSGMTVADRGFLLLLAQKNGWNPGGNSDYGNYYADGSRWQVGKSITVGTKRGYKAGSTRRSKRTHRAWNSRRMFLRFIGNG